MSSARNHGFNSAMPGALRAGLSVAAVLSLCLPLAAYAWGQFQTLSMLSAQGSDAKTLQSRLTEQEGSLRATRERYEIVSERLDEDQSMASVLEILSQRARTCKVEVAAIQASSESGEIEPIALSPELSLRQVPLTLRLTGGYRQIGEFLAGLNQAPVLINVRELRMSPIGPGRGALHTEASLLVTLAERRALR